MIRNIFYIIVIVSTLVLLFFWHNTAQTDSQEVMHLITGSNAPYRYDIVIKKDEIGPSKKDESINYNTPTLSSSEIEILLRSQCNILRTGAWSCDHMIATFKAENYTLSPTRRSATQDLGICQLHIASHKWFMKQEYKYDAHKQVEYCASVWNNAFERGIHPSKRRYAYR